MRSRRIAVALAGLAGLLVTAACAPDVTAGWVPPAWPETAVRIMDAAPEPIDPATLPAMTPQRLRNAAAGVHARMSYLSGTDAAAKSLNASIDSAIRAAIKAQGRAYRPAVEARGAGLGDRGCVPGSTLLAASDVLADPGLAPPGGSGVTIICDIVAAQGDILGQRIRVVTAADGAVVSDTSTIVYVDTATGERASAEELWRADAVTGLGDDVLEILRREGGALAPSQLGNGEDDAHARVRAALATTVPTTGGALAFTLPVGFEASVLIDLGMAATSAPITIEVPADRVTVLASEFGQRLAAASDVPFSRTSRGVAGRDWVDCSLVPCVALTYDDGPSSWTPRLLDVLAEAQAPATFFVLGPYAARNQGIVSRAFAEGHEVAGHTWNHPDLTTLTDEQIRDELGRTNSLLRNITGAAVTSFRPPYGAVDARVRGVAGLPAVLWSVDTRDWAGPSDAALLDSAVGDADPGAIVLFHDTHERSVRLAPEVISGLRDRGFTPTTVTQLFGGKLPASGHLRRAPH